MDFLNGEIKAGVQKLLVNLGIRKMADRNVWHMSHARREGLSNGFAKA